jgi:cellulose synthase/poly-beta-1,6-N-acetylglucosamine synthase-like glycosyltransferase
MPGSHRLTSRSRVQPSPANPQFVTTAANGSSTSYMQSKLQPSQARLDSDLGLLANYAVIVCAHNEAHNLGSLLPRLNRTRTIVVNDGSSDQTGATARALGFEVLDHPLRLGKAASLRDGITFAKDHHFEVAVDIGADAIPKEGSIEMLVLALGENGVGGASARQVPKKAGTEVAFKIDEVIWAVLACGKDLQMRRNRDSYLGAVMFAFKLAPVHMTDVTNDDELVGSCLKSKGLRVVFLKNAIAYFDASESIRHVLERRRRMFYGHIENFRSGAPSKSRSLSLIALAFAIREEPRRFPWAAPAIVIEVASRMRAWSDYRRGRSQAYRRWVSVYKNPEMDHSNIARS